MPETENLRPTQGGTRYTQNDVSEGLERFESGFNQMYPDNPRDIKHLEAMNSKAPSKFYDPCKLTSQMSLNCLDRVRYDRKRAKVECREFFDAYKECKAEWRNMKKEANRIW
ncbi:uncharacterized protein V1516DRAFT_632132 [Lipomyces oligophaga]|uniref:uncharacterized protein n=1 Tax=Lipomyces oligophaga TaxID=45792 RepID=UPI0034CD03C8